MNSNEEWKDIPGWEGFYQVSNLGRVKSIFKYLKTKKGELIIVKTNKILKQGDNHGYKAVHLKVLDKQLHTGVHRLVAQAFLPNDNNYTEINHIDENGMNNNVNNLEWCSRSYNIKYGNRTKKSIKTLGKAVLQYTLEGVLLNEYDSIQRAAYYNNVNSWGICDCCKGRIPEAYGYIWRYKDEI